MRIFVIYLPIIYFIATERGAIMKEFFNKRFANVKSRKEEKSFYMTLLLSFLVISISSTIVLTIFLTLNFFNSLSSTTKNYNQQLLSQTNYTIDQIDANADRLTASILNNTSVVSFLSISEMESLVSIQAGQEIAKQLQVLPYVDSIYLYNANLDLMYSSKNGYLQAPENFKEQEITENLKDPSFFSSYDGVPIPYGKNTETDSAEILSYYVFDNFPRDDAKRNAIVINVKASMLTDSISSMKKFTNKTEGSFLLLDQNNTFITDSLNPEIKNTQQWRTSVLHKLSKKDALQSSFIKIDGTMYFQTNTDTNTYGWKLLNFIPVRVLYHEILVSALLSTFILCVILVLTWFICHHFARRLNEPLENLTHLVKGKKDGISFHQGIWETKEFQTILSNISSLLESNEQLRSMQQKTRYSLIQSCLNELVTDGSYDSPQLLYQKLDHLNLTYLTKDTLCMAIFKIDNYQTFLSEHNSDELWIIRFSVVNIIEELVSESFTCNAFSRDDDKFALLIACPEEKDLVTLEDEILLLFQSIQKNIEMHLHFTLTVAFSTFFRNLEQLPAIYKHTENSLLLKMRYGHNSIIDPYQIDEVSDDSFQLSYKFMSQLTDQLIAGNLKSSYETYEKLTQDLFLYDYTEITSTMMHFAHNIYERLTEKYPMVKDSITTGFKSFLTNLETAEISDDIQNLAYTFFKSICNSVQQVKENPAQHNSAILAEKIAQIIEENYTDPAICLSSIAEEIGLSANYTGHIFKQYSQKSVAQYLLEVRMEKVAYYLQTTSLPLSKILDKVGMEKNNYFYTRFKNYFGMSLGEYKQKFRSSDDDEA